MAHQCSFISRCVDESVLQDQHLSLTVETEQASLERAWDLKEKENTLEAKQQRLNAISAGMISVPAAGMSVSIEAQDSTTGTWQVCEGGMCSRWCPVSADIEAGKRRLSQHVSQCNDYMKKILVGPPVCKDPCFRRKRLYDDGMFLTAHWRVVTVGANAQNPCAGQCILEQHHGRLEGWSDSRPEKGSPMCVMQDLQKDFKEADKQRTDLVQMRTDIAKKLKEKEDDLSSQT